MSKYRIRIDELNSGEKRYTPQIATFKTTSLGGFLPIPFLLPVWENICRDNILKKYELTTTKRELYDTEREALDVIEDYKNYIINKNSKALKRVTYKKLK